VADKVYICQIYTDNASRVTRTVKTVDIRSHIQNFIDGKKYFTIAAVRKYLVKKSVPFKDQTLRQYLYGLKLERVIHDAGYGWYSTIAQSFKLDTGPLTELVALLAKEYPLLPFACWSTAQMLGYSHHLPTRFVGFLYVDFDEVMTVFEFLRDENFNVFANPRKSESEKQFTIRDRTVVIRPLVTESPVAGHYATIEKILVDLFIEKNRLTLMDGAEYRRVAGNILGSARINMARTLRYASRREMRQHLLAALAKADPGLVCV
jgi:hypothetical protein